MIILYLGTSQPGFLTSLSDSGTRHFRPPQIPPALGKGVVFYFEG